MTTLADRIAAELGGNIRGAAWDERELQDAVDHVLAACPWARVSREHALGRADRPDFVVDLHPMERTLYGIGESAAGLVAVEVKIGGSASNLIRQVDRYASHGEVIGVLVVTTKMTLMRLPTTLRGKPIRGCLIRGGL